MLRLSVVLRAAGLHVHNVELRPGQGGKLVRSAGSSAIYQSRKGLWCHDCWVL